MSKVAVSDSTNFKFCKDLIKHWQKKHEVKQEIGASEFLAEWCDIYYLDWIDNNAHYLFKWYKEHPLAKKPKFVVRVIDWDFWVRGVRSQGLVDFVDYWICIAPHIGERLLLEKDDETGLPIQWGDKLKLIRPGVNLTQFTIRQKETNGYQIGMVLGDMWWYKNHMAGLDLFAELDNDYHLHIRGQHEPGEYNRLMYEHFIKSRGLENKVTLYPFQDNMSDWYENIDILLHPGLKETFCYAVGEALAKGIQPVINNFYGAEEIWPKKWLYNNGGDAMNAIMAGDEDTPAGRRQYIIDNYSNEKMFQAIDTLLGL